jgi:integrase/recombinase XerD
MELQKFYDWLKLNKNSQKTIKTYYQMINCFGKLCDYNFNQENLDKYIIKLKDENKSPATINLFLVSIRGYCKYANINLNIPVPKKVKRKAIKFYLTEENLYDVLKEYYDLDDLILRFMFYTGVRPSELLNLKIEHINFKTRDIILYNAKGNKDRIIPFTNDKLFNDMKKYCQDKEDKVFKFSYGKLNYLLKNVKKTLQLNDSDIVEPRTMRISFAKYCLSKGMDISYLKKLMGHSDIKITELYAEPDQKMIKDFCEQIRKEK